MSWGCIDSGVIHGIPTWLAGISNNEVFSNFWLVVGPFQECFSCCGLWIAKFHGLLHIVFYIQRFGSTLNFFGGFCESHLKTLIKAPTKNTSHWQDHLDLELMKWLHKKHVCLAAEKKLQDKGWYKGKEDKRKDPITQPPAGQSAMSGSPPDVFTLGSLRFSAECDPS